MMKRRLPLMSILITILSISLGYSSTLLDPLNAFMSKYPPDYRPWSYKREDFDEGAPYNDPWLFFDNPQYVLDIQMVEHSLRRIYNKLARQSLVYQKQLAEDVDEIVYCELFYHEELSSQLGALVADVTTNGFNSGTPKIFATLYQFLTYYPGQKARIGVVLFRAPSTVSELHSRIFQVLTRTELVLARSTGPSLLDVLNVLMSVHNYPTYFTSVLRAQLSFMIARTLDVFQTTSVDWLSAPVLGRFREFTGAYSTNYEMAAYVTFDQAAKNNALQLWSRAFATIPAKQAAGMSAETIAEFAEPYLRSYVLWFNLFSPGQQNVFCTTIIGMKGLTDILIANWSLKNLRYGNYWSRTGDNTLRIYCPQITSTGPQTST